MSASITYMGSAIVKSRKMANDMNNVLLMDTKRLAGVYVVTDGLDSKKVIASAKNPQQAYKSAIARGVSDPVLIYVPTESEKTAVLWQNS